MRSRITWVLVMLLLVGCGIQPLKQFGPEPSTAPTWVVSFDGVLTEKLPDIKPLAQVKKLKGDISFAPPLNGMHAAWRTYLEQLRDGRLDTHPTPIKALELDEGQVFGSVCNPGPNHRFPAEAIQPMYCADGDLGDEIPALMVLPTGFTDKAQALATAYDEQTAWALVAVLASLTYAVHLRHEVAITRITWPDGTPFDYCVAGIGLRAVFTADGDVLDDERAATVLAEVDRLTHPTDSGAERLEQLMTGYNSGRLEQCVA